MKNTSKQNRPSSKNKHNRGKNCLLFDEFQDQKTWTFVMNDWKQDIKDSDTDTYLELVRFPLKKEKSKTNVEC